MSKYKTVIHTLDGVYESDPGEVITNNNEASKVIEEITSKFFKEWPNLKYLTLMIDGEEVFFNPANIISAKVVPA